MMKLYTVLTIMSLSFLHCSLTKKRDNLYRAINVIQDMQLVSEEDMKLFNVRDTLTIIYYKDIILYQIGSPYENTFSSYDKNDSIISERIEAGTKYNFYIYKKGDSFGVKYDSMNVNIGRRFVVDSLLKKKRIFSGDILLEANYDLVEKNREANNFIEKYTPKVKKDETYPDSTYLYYTKALTDIDYSFSKKLDSIKAMKLSKIRIIFNPIQKGVDFPEIPRRELSFEIKEAIVTNSKQIIDFLERFKNCCVGK